MDYFLCALIAYNFFMLALGIALYSKLTGDELEIKKQNQIDYVRFITPSEYSDAEIAQALTYVFSTGFSISDFGKKRLE